MYKCLKCEKEFDKYGSLSRHVGITHKLPTDQFYVDYYLKGVWPLCKCGCRETVKWSWQLKGFRDYCQGHQSRVHNNWGHNPKAIENSAETRRRQFDSGERTVWNDGLTKETSDSVKLNGELRSKAYTPEIKDEYSKRMKRNRLDRTVPSLYGSDHPNWKGGVSEVNILARTDKRLYDEWKYPILIRDGFKCVECDGVGGGLHIHHDKEQMCEIVKKHMPDTDIITDFGLKKSIASKIVDYHITNHVSGITLCGKCHNKIHPSLNFG